MIRPDRATVYAMSNRVWTSASGLLVALLVATFFSPVLQGYYFTFTSLLTLQTFLELGLGEVVQQFASHEWANLTSERGAVSEKAQRRLASLVRFALRWYVAVALLMFTGLGLLGQFFFRTNPSNNAPDWELAWWFAAACAACSALLTPVLSLLEGCNRVRKVHGVRLTQSIASRLAAKAAIVTGAGLLTVALARAVTVVVGVLGLFREGSRLLLPAYSRANSVPVRETHSISFRHEIWPLQWRIALSWLSGYVLYSLFTPVIFAFHGPVAAGQMGMTVAAAAAISSAGFAVVTTKVPRLAMHAACGRYQELNAIFVRATGTALVVSTAGSLVFFIGLLGAGELDAEISNRFLPPRQTAWLLAAVVLQQLRYAMGSYLRAHKKEPFAYLATAEALIAVPLFVALAVQFGTYGMVVGFFALTTASLVPAVAIFEHCRTLWHERRAQMAEAEAEA
jgi:O-antigen/teichoic acid export membrane protein